MPTVPLSGLYDVWGNANAYYHAIKMTVHDPVSAQGNFLTCQLSSVSGGVVDRFVVSKTGSLSSFSFYSDPFNYQGYTLYNSTAGVTLAALTSGSGTDNLNITLAPAGAGNLKIQTPNGYVTIGEYDVYGNMLITNGASKAIVIGESGTQTILTGASGGLTRFNFFGRNYLNGSTRSSGLLEFGELGDAASSCPALKRNGTELQVRLADDSDFTSIRGANFDFISQSFGGFGYPTYQVRLNAGTALAMGCAVNIYSEPTVLLTASGPVLSQHNGTNAQTFRVYGTYTDSFNYVRASLSSSLTSVTLAAETSGTGADNVNLTLVPAGAGLIGIGGQTSNHPALKRSGTELQVRLADDSGYAPIAASSIVLNVPTTLGPVWTLGSSSGEGYGLSLNTNGYGMAFVVRGSGPTGPNLAEGMGVGNLYVASRVGWGQNMSIGQEPGSGTHTYIFGESSGVLGQRNSTNAQTLRVYGTYTDNFNYVRASLSSSLTSVTLAAETSGTGADNVDVNITPAGTGSVNLGSKAKIGTATLSHDGFATLSIDSVIAQNATHFSFYGNRAGAGTWAGMDGFAVRDSSFYAFANVGYWYGTIDLALARNAAGVAEINNGTPGTYRDLRLRSLSSTSGTLTASSPGIDISQTWNNAAVAFQGARIKITNNASLPSPYGYTHGSMPFVITDGSDNVMSGFGRDGGLWFGGVYYSQSRLYKTGSFGVTILDCSPFGGGNGGFEVFGGTDHQVGALINPLATYPTVGFSFGLSNRLGNAANAARQFWYNDGTIHQRNGNVAQTYYIYGAYTDNFNYVRASLSSSLTSVTLAAETSGTGADNVNLTLVPAGAGLIGIGGQTSNHPALKRNGTELQVRLADDSAYANLAINTLYVGNNGQVTTPGALGGWRFYNGLGPIMDGSGGQVIFDTDADYTLALRYSTNPQTFRVYGTYTNASNYVRASVAATSAAVTIAAETSGTGADDVGIDITSAGNGNIVLKVGGTARATFTASAITLGSDHYVGNGAGYWRFSEGDGYIYYSLGGQPYLRFGADVIKQSANGAFAWASSNASLGATDLAISRNAAGIAEINNGTPGTYRDLRLRSLSSTSGTLTASSPGIHISQTWNNGSTLFEAAKISITNTASNSNSRYLKMETDGNQDFAFTRGGALYFGTQDVAVYKSGTGIRIGRPDRGNLLLDVGGYDYTYQTLSWYIGEYGRGVTLAMEAQDTLSMRYSTNAQTFRVYGTYTDNFNYVRASLSSSLTSVTLAAETSGTGADNVDVNITPAGTGKVVTPAIVSANSYQFSSGASITSASLQTLVFVGEYGGMRMEIGQDVLARKFLCSGEFAIGWGTGYGTGNLSNIGAAFYKDTDNVIAQRNSTNAQTFRVYGTYTDASNYVRASLSATSTSVTLAAETAGTGADNVDINLTPAGAYAARLVLQGSATSNPGWSIGETAASPCIAGSTGAPNSISFKAYSFSWEQVNVGTAMVIESGTGCVGIGTTSPTAYLDLPASTTSVASLRIRTGTAPTSANSGDLWHDSTRRSLQFFTSGGLQTLNGTTFTQTESVTVADTVTETVITGSGVGTLTLPAGFFVPGKTFKIRALGFHSSTASPTITIRMKLNSTTVLSTGAITSGNGTDDAWIVDTLITCRSSGDSGEVIGQGYYEEIHGNGNRGGMVNTTPVVIDTTVEQEISITAEWGTADTSNSITCTNAVVEILN